MKNKVYKEGIMHWLTEEKGGRGNLPPTDVYYATTIIPFNEIKYWSIKIKFDFILSKQYILPCKVTFLVPDAPFELLDKMKEIDVYEGPKKVGIVVL